ncbi:T9SS type A sorting domain-containing protein [Flavobacterium sp.]|uniref:T9SS type A sorting domain-containing protein n=1 Tax=Flavobacterium sp. TaxID=239 RepID=UPI00120EBD1F|nr:T9SS type A sorting domain-containing protein [Flavobacterium sp.]RZJ70221.1 MAG: T9SS type A sorting domain-containing protein [Flavobacterium sp.]
MYKYFTLILLAMTISSVAQMPGIGWQKRYGSGADAASCIIRTTNGDFVTCGKRRQQVGSAARENGHVARISPNGDLLWTYDFGGNGDDYLESVVQLDNGGFFAIGYADLGEQNYQYFVWGVWLDADGNLINSQFFGPTEYSNIGMGLAVKKTTDGGFVVCGQKGGNFFLMKLNAAGQIAFEQTYTPSIGKSRALDIIETSTGDFVLCGTGSSVQYANGNQLALVVKTNAQGALLWTATLNENGDEWYNKIREDANGNYILAGNTYSNDGQLSGNHGSSDGLVSKITASGNFVWHRTIGGSSGEIFKSLLIAPDGGYYLAGQTTTLNDGQVFGNHSANTSQADVYLVKTDSEGNFEWSGCYGGSQFEQAYDMTYNVSGQLVVSGYAASSDGQVETSNIGRSWVLKLGENLSDKDHSLRAVIYPNPVADELHFSSDGIPFESASIFDVNGRLLKIAKGSISSLDVSDLTSGIYVLECKGGNSVLRSKFVKR